MMLSELEIPITIAIPKGRLQKKIFEYFTTCGIVLQNPDRNLIIEHSSKKLKILLVKNSDLPEYVHGGIASIGIVGTDVIGESNYSFFSLGVFPFGHTKFCLISKQQTPSIDIPTQTTVASKYVEYTRVFLKKHDIKANIIKLNGAVEIAPLLGLAPYTIDLVETGKTLQENGLIIQEEIGKVQVELIANKALYKLNYKDIDEIVRFLKL